MNRAEAAGATGGSKGPRPRVGLSVHGRIDLWRGALAWLVVACHGFATSYALHPRASEALTPSQHALLDHTVNAGFVWVMGFFVLSGYCIHQSVDRRLSGPDFPIGPYLLARMTRILPLYYAALAFAVIANPWIAWDRIGGDPGLDLPGIAGQVLMVQNLGHCYGSFTPSWSLTNEVFYYGLYGALAWMAGGVRSRPFRVGLGICLVVGGSLQAAYVLGFKAPIVLKSGLLFGLGVNWFLGVGVAVYRVRIRRSTATLALARAWPIVLALAFVGYHAGFGIQSAYVLSGVAFAMLLVRIVAAPEPEGGIVEPAWATRLTRFAGLSSYPTYLFHNTFVWLLGSAMVRWGWPGSWPALWATLVAAGLGLGAALGWSLERPLMRWRADFLRRVEGGAGAPRFSRHNDPGGVRLGRESA